MEDDQSSPPLARRVPGATRAAPNGPGRPVLPEALLQRMQAVVSAAHAQVAEEEQRLADEEEARRGRAARQDRAAAGSSLPRRIRAAGGGRKLPVDTALPLSSPPGWSNADDDTSPLPRLTASGAVAVPDANGVGVQPERHPARDARRAGAGASAGIPLRSAELSESGGATALQKWLAFLRARRYPFVPALTQTIRLDGKPVLLIEFSAPTPLGLLAS